MEKRYGATERGDRLMKIGRNKWELSWGYGSDGERGWTWRERFGHRPTEEELKELITAQINSNVDERIQSGLTWQGMKIWLSMENQFNYKAAYDLAKQTAGATLPVRFKFGTDEQPIYHSFETIEELEEFHSAMIEHVQRALEEGWKEKDSLDIGAIKVEEYV